MERNTSQNPLKITQNHHNSHSNIQTTLTLYFIQIAVFLLGEQMRVSVFSGIDLSDKQRLEPAVFAESKTPAVKPNTQV